MHIQLNIPEVNDTIQGLLDRHLERNKRRSNTALAFPTCRFLWDILTHEADYVDPRHLRVADLGSGMSTLAIRAWAKWYGDLSGRPPINVTTDHLEGWLKSTKKNIEDEGLPASHFLLEDDWEATDDTVYDVIFVDFDGPPLRISHFEDYEKRLSDAGLFIFDDWQFPHLRAGLVPKLEETGYTIQDMHATKDEYRRYVAIAYKGNRLDNLDWY